MSAPRQTAGLLVEQRDAVAWLRINRPAKRNALDAGIIRALYDALNALPEQTRAIVLSGEGEHFCAGLDLNEAVEMHAAEGLFHSRLWQRAFDAIENASAPVIAVIQGAVVGGGLELAAAAHLRVAESTAYYALPEGLRGIFTGGGGAVRIPRLIGLARMTDMLLTGRVFSAEEGQQMALSNYLTKAGEGLALAFALAERVARNAPLSNYAVLQALPRIARTEGEAGYLLEALMAAVAQGDAEAKARLRDFLAGRAEKAGPS
ncbi:crotonase/enoyl-CoA hydratase family protein [Acidihalobacter prosperus]|uniref:Enoyl-CoA hydratase n=1 Tax=Acidihalobacter prosperus TaxID=160660 RepID=A0A1A6C7X9_9GAMM|nr:crotonase/enoyl-CoA hydratase family protein [Acidihalobacter prosperus]OBS10672.1 enoyl-CoA hydratase [Acidihalobacter prosperus]